jgi:hypothetical protein
LSEKTRAEKWKYPVTKEERRILSPLVQQLRLDDPAMWTDLKYQTQFGPEFADFPYYPAALEFQEPAQQLIDGLDTNEKSVLVAQWKSKSRYPYTFTDDPRILRQYAVIAVDQLVQRAKQAGSRTSEF